MITRTVGCFRGMIGPPFELVVAYVVAMPLLAGLPRDVLLPVVRPSEALQLVVTAGGVALAVWALIAGGRWRLRIQPLEWWLLAMATAGSVLPLLWLLARSQPVGTDELLAAFPVVKYAALYFLVRGCVRSESDVDAVSKAMVFGAAIVAAIAVTQALGVGPMVELLGRFFVSSTEDVVDGGRGTTTIGSSIATGAYLVIACGFALSRGLGSAGAVSRGLPSAGAVSRGLPSAGRRWLVLAIGLGIGALASGQAGTVLGLGVVVIAVARLHRRSAELIAWGTPAAALATIGLWPIVVARLADLDHGSGLPAGWIVRWNNLSELYLPSLLDGGWLLGVNPDAVLTPPDVWRQSIYLESGYLWLLWVGGVPLLVAAVAFLVCTWRSLDPRRAAPEATDAVRSARIAARAAVAMVAVLSVIDPHLTLRGGADLFFIVIALALVGEPLAVPVVSGSERWRRLMESEPAGPRYRGIRLQLAEAPSATVESSSGDSSRGETPELTLALTAQYDGSDVGTAALTLYRTAGDLRGLISQPVDGTDREAVALTWRAVALTARSLRLVELVAAIDADGTDNADVTEPTGGRQAGSAGRAVRIDRAELELAARLAWKLELERAAESRSWSGPQAGLGGRRDQRCGQPADERGAADGSPTAIRIDLGARPPRWKRAVDIAVGLTALGATAPLWLLCGLLVRRSSHGPILYRQVRIGTGGLPFQIYKFRTMYVGNDDSSHRIQNRLELQGQAEAAKEKTDPRITPTGRLLRRLSLDELPQLVNVLRAEMSLVGPRPALVWECELFGSSARRRLVARPGLTGLWQTSGRADVSMSDMLELDLDYVDRMSPLVDLRCLLKTASSVVGGRGAR